MAQILFLIYYSKQFDAFNFKKQELINLFTQLKKLQL